MGYDRPMDVFEAGSTDPARNDAGALDSYLSGVQASHHGAPSLDTVVGHSYGSTPVGAAGSDGHHLPAENIVGIGSPGMLVNNASSIPTGRDHRLHDDPTPVATPSPPRCRLPGGRRVNWRLQRQEQSGGIGSERRY
jgi:hypothetical protein